MVGESLPKTLVTGGEGIVGSALPFGEKLGRQTLDVTNPANVKKVFLKEKPTIVVHPAALTDVDYCEGHSSEAYFTNTFGTYNIAYWSNRIRATLVLISTGAVFAGREPAKINDLTHPVNIYGRTKLAAEIIARDVNPKTLIVRTGWVFGGRERDKKFVGKILEQVRKGSKILHVPKDNIGCPTYAQDFGQGVYKLLKKPKPGTYHLVNKGTASRYEIALEIVRLLGVKVVVKPVLQSQLPLLAPRPLREVLVPSRPYLRSWKEALAEYLKEMYL